MAVGDDHEHAPSTTAAAHAEAPRSAAPEAGGRAEACACAATPPPPLPPPHRRRPRDTHGPSPRGDDVHLKAAQRLAERERRPTSKYDYVKVRVWLGGGAQGAAGAHYYVLSRFIIARTLTVTRVPTEVAIKVALDLKKRLVDREMLDVPQHEMEEELFDVLRRRGYGERYVRRYRMVSAFHLERVPLVLLVCGTQCVGKSTAVRQLSERLNLSSVLQTDVVHALLAADGNAPLEPEPLWARGLQDDAAVLDAYSRECRVVCRGVTGDLRKAIVDGKTVVIEGFHVDPSLYARAIRTLFEEACAERAEQAAGAATQGSPSEPSILAAGGSSPERATPTTRELREPIVLPVVLTMDPVDQEELMTSWLPARVDTYGGETTGAVMKTLQVVQAYLARQGVPVVPARASDMPSVIDFLHDYFLRGVAQHLGEDYA